MTPYVLVTGVAGFIGSHVAEALLAEGHRVVGVDCFTDYYDRGMKEDNLRALRDEARFDLVERDLADCDVEALTAGVSAVFHLAAQPGVRASWGEFSSYLRNNVMATQRLLEALRGSGARLVYSSSSSVYGSAETLPTDESLLPQPVSPYGTTKLAGEHLCRLYAAEMGVATVSLRYFTVYGPRQRPDMAFRRFIEAGLTGTGLTVYGDGEQSRDFTFVGDVVEANLAALRHGAAGAVYNIGGGSRVTVNEILEMIGDLLGEPLSVTRVARQAGDAAHTAADTSAARRVLGYAPNVSLREGLAREIAWMRERAEREDDAAPSAAVMA